MTPIALAQLHARCFTHPRPWSAEEFTKLADDATFHLHHVDGGFIVGRTAAGSSELLTLVVSPERRRQGLGRLLVHTYEAEAAARGGRESYLEVSVENHAARTLYENLGYVQIGLRPNYYAGRDAVILRKALQFSEN